MERLDQSLDGVVEIRSQISDHNDLNNSDHLSDHRNVPTDRTDNQQTSHKSNHKNSKITVTRITEIILGWVVLW
jgi:hypothetical protein